MSRFLKNFAPTGTGVVGALVLAFVLADQIVTDSILWPFRGMIVTAAKAEGSTTAANVATNSMTEAAPHAPMGGFGLGRGALPEEIAAWDIDVRPDGQGLPEGRGDVLAGEEIFTEKCASCHGDFGESVGRWPVLAGGFDTLTSERPVKTIGSYWPYLSTVYDYVNRTMPFGDARSLSNDDVYALTAYILFLNDQVEEGFELSDENFVEIKLPNEASFYLDDRGQTELGEFAAEPCMENCKPSVEIVMRARVLDVTPETAEDDAPVEASAQVETVESEAAPTVGNPALIEAGKSTFKKCKACHQVGESAKNRSGPQLNNLFGRTAGGIDGFKYSNAFKEKSDEGLIWTDETLAAFLEKPRAYIKGTKMSFRGLSEPEDVAAVLEYLRTFTN